MKHSRPLSPTASPPDFLAFAKEVQTRLPQHRALSPEVVQGLERLGRFFQVLRIRQHWSLQSLATQTGLSSLQLALLEQGILLPDELTDEMLDTLGKAFLPLLPVGPAPAEWFRTMERALCRLQLPAEEEAVTRIPQAAHAPTTPSATPPLETCGDTGRQSHPARRVRWLEPWHPSLAGERAAAAGTPTQKYPFKLKKGMILVTWRWWAAEPGYPAEPLPRLACRRQLRGRVMGALHPAEGRQGAD